VFRQSADYYCEDVFTASTSNFAHTIKEVTGGVLFRITGPGGSVAGYDASTNWLNTVRPVRLAMSLGFSATTFLKKYTRVILNLKVPIFLYYSNYNIVSHVLI
jgi:hypothetical protein